MLRSAEFPSRSDVLPLVIRLYNAVITIHITTKSTLPQPPTTYFHRTVGCVSDYLSHNQIIQIKNVQFYHLKDSNRACVTAENAPI